MTHLCCRLSLRCENQMIPWFVCVYLKFQSSTHFLFVNRISWQLPFPGLFLPWHASRMDSPWVMPPKLLARAAMQHRALHSRSLRMLAWTGKRAEKPREPRAKAKGSSRWKSGRHLCLCLCLVWISCNAVNWIGLRLRSQSYLPKPLAL